jgi:4-hydroxy-2-oxoheptanedioate aldolase
LAAAAETGGAAPIVRPRTNAPAEIQRALDIGSAGVQVPQVTTHEEAVAARDAARFDPLGERGLSQYVRAGGYTGSENYTQQQNEDTALIVQVEGQRGVDNIKEIVEVEGIDAIFLGPYDLSQSLGIPGQVRHERVEERMTTVCEIAQAADTAVGTFADDPAMAQRWAEVGVQYLMVSVPAAQLRWQLESIVDDLN